MDPEEGEAGAGYGVEDEEAVGGGIEVHHHVGAYLVPVEAVAQDFKHGHHLEGADVEHEDVERVVATIHEEPLQAARMAFDPLRDVMHRQEANHASDGESEHVDGIGFERHAVEAERRTAHECAKE